MYRMVAKTIDQPLAMTEETKSNVTSIESSDATSVGFKVRIDKIDGKKVILLDCQPSDTINGLKKKIEDQYGLPSANYRLTYFSLVLDENRSLGYYGFKSSQHVGYSRLPGAPPTNNLIQQLVLRVEMTSPGDDDGGDVEVVLTDLDGKEYSVNFNLYWTIGTLKSLVEDKFGIAANRLIILHKGRKLEDEYLFKHYKIGYHHLGSMMSHLQMLVVSE
jgi:hypothetical protein